MLRNLCDFFQIHGQFHSAQKNPRVLKVECTEQSLKGNSFFFSSESLHTHIAYIYVCVSPFRVTAGDRVQHFTATLMTCHGVLHSVSAEGE